jgi:type II secretory pathway pseudopilin PulG
MALKPGQGAAGSVHSRSIAFTLIELLVVICIIVVLAGLLLPALNRAKATTQSLVCRSNLKQFGYAWHMYGLDFDSKIPPNHANDGSGPWNDGYTWVKGSLNCSLDDVSDNTNTFFLGHSLVGPYLGGCVPVWKCPSDRSVP